MDKQPQNWLLWSHKRIAGLDRPAIHKIKIKKYIEYGKN